MSSYKEIDYITSFIYVTNFLKNRFTFERKS